MKKVKKIFAILMTLAMIMGLGMTSMAGSNEVTITVNNADNANFVTAQVVVADRDKDTGWEIASEYQSAFKTAFDETDTQKIIKGMIYAENSAATEGVEINDFAQKYAAALKSITDTFREENAHAAPIKASSAGLYVIKGFETDYEYSPMAVFVGMDMQTGKPNGLLTPTEVNAKKEPNKSVKSSDDADKVVEVGRTVTYSVESTVPYFADTEEHKEYWLKDTITGATYNATANSLTVTIYLKNSDDLDYENVFATATATVTGNSFVCELTDILDVANNTYANKDIKVTYQATVTDLLIHNTAKFGDGSNDGRFGTDSDKLITGTVTFTKTGDGGAYLNGAEFVLVKTEQVEGKTVTKYATFKEEPEGTYTLTGWVTDVTKATRLTTKGTDDNGKDIGQFVVQGLEKDGNYAFDEMKAPDGYSINDDNVNITWSEIPEELDKVVTGTSTMADTKLANLPGTGGIGTTIFTIGGIVIMIAAAALFFANRRKNNAQ